MANSGIDSMQVIKASRLLRAGLASALGHDVAASALSTRILYNNPSPRMLARYIMRNVVEVNGVNGTNGASNPEEQHQRDMKTIYDKYTQSLIKVSNTQC